MQATPFSISGLICECNDVRGLCHRNPVTLSTVGMTACISAVMNSKFEIKINKYYTPHPYN
jgi:hypothetical protein